MIAFLTVCAALSSPPAIPTEQLLAGVQSLHSGGNPASLIAWDQAQPLVVSPEGRIFAAATTLGAGRIVALGHGGFIGTDEADSEVFAANAVLWLAGEATQPVRIFGLPKAVEGELQTRAVEMQVVRGSAGDVDLANVDVVIGSPQAFAKAGRLDELREWIADGGGMLLTETAWGILQLNPDLTLESLAANALLEPAGLRFTGDSHSGWGPNRDYAVDASVLASANAERALAILAGGAEGDSAIAAKVAGVAFSGLPLSSPLVQHALQLRTERAQELDAAFAGIDSERLTPGKHALGRALIDLDARMGLELPAREMKAHPSSTAFPGPLGPERAGQMAFTLESGVPGWQTTGLYAPPGEIVRVRVPEWASDAGLVVQIGAWRDPHTHGYRQRIPTAIRRFAVTTAETEVASIIGGPIYIDVPGTFWESASGRDVQITIDGAALAPHFRLGKTDPAEWRETIRYRSAPWAEFESDNLVFTVPSNAVRDVEDPEAVMRHWDRVHEAMQSLEPRTPNHWADRPYRYVADVSVSWGYMYCPADGPIVIPTSAAAAMFDLDNFDAEGPNNLWGHYHEMGHAHQNPLWTDRATGEVTVNIFTVYALHMVNGFPLDAEATRTDPSTAWSTFARHRDSGKPYEDVGGPFPRLQYYALLWHAFGFEPFHAAFDSIRALPAAERPKDETQERNTFLVHFSRAVGRSLVGYGEAWGIEVTDDTRRALADLPAWMPEEPGSDATSEDGTSEGRK